MKKRDHFHSINLISDILTFFHFQFSRVCVCECVLLSLSRRCVKTILIIYAVNMLIIP